MAGAQVLFAGAGAEAEQAACHQGPDRCARQASARACRACSRHRCHQQVRATDAAGVAACMARGASAIRARPAQMQRARRPSQTAGGKRLSRRTAHCIASVGVLLWTELPPSTAAQRSACTNPSALLATAERAGPRATLPTRRPPCSCGAATGGQRRMLRAHARISPIHPERTLRMKQPTSVHQRRAPGARGRAPAACT